MLLSKSKLIPLLIENGFIDSEKKVGYEAFGRKVCAFVYVKDMAERKRLEAFLQKMKIPVKTSYSPGSTVVETQVTYFKAWHWDE